MDNHIEQTVYDYLVNSMAEIEKTPAKHNLDAVEAEIKNGRYTDKALTDEIYPYREKLRTSVRGMYNEAMDGARKLIAEYRTEAERLNDLNPDDINDDVKLLQTGVDLLPRDIEALLRRNNTNRTMVQLVLRYAKAHNIDTSSMYVGTADEVKRADTLTTTLKYFEKWIDKPNGRDTLDRFFGVK